MSVAQRCSRYSAISAVSLVVFTLVGDCESRSRVSRARRSASLVKRRDADETSGRLETRRVASSPPSLRVATGHRSRLYFNYSVARFAARHA